ncbi:MAG: hypothetical protein KDC80_17520 [Saprospiraceae bacterium]|nr:hypothetical protein [Saprospiraceae bacterium]
MEPPEDADSRARYLDVMIPTIRTTWLREIAEFKSKDVLNSVQHTSRLLDQAYKLDKDLNIGRHILSITNNINLYEVSNKPVSEFINSVRKHHSGKAIILDLWATWCSPCIEDMKKSKSLKTEIEDLPLSIVYLCSSEGSTSEKWQRKVAETETKGDHLYLDNKLSTQIMEFFQLSGYPSFIYIDSEGSYHPKIIRQLSSMSADEIRKIVRKYP